MKIAEKPSQMINMTTIKSDEVQEDNEMVERDEDEDINEFDQINDDKMKIFMLN